MKSIERYRFRSRPHGEACKKPLSVPVFGYASGRGVFCGSFWTNCSCHIRLDHVRTYGQHTDQQVKQVYTSVEQVYTYIPTYSYNPPSLPEPGDRRRQQTEW